MDDLKKYTHGTMHDELNWIDIQQHAMRILSAEEKVVSITSDELITRKDVVDRARDLGYNVITIPSSLRQRIRGQKDVKGKTIVDLNEFNKIDNESFEFKFIEPKQLKLKEKEVFEKTDKILKLIGGKPNRVKKILISENMRKDFLSITDPDGLWEPSKKRIVIHRRVLKSLPSFSGTLLHEIAHVTSGAGDNSRWFEQELTKYIGILTESAIQKK